MARTVAGNGRTLEQVNYAPRARLLAGLAPRLTPAQAAAQAQAVIAEMSNAAIDPGKGARLANPLRAVRQLTTALAPLVSRLSPHQAEKYATEAAALLLAARHQEPNRSRDIQLAEGVQVLAAHTSATSAAALADVLVASLARTTDGREAAILAGALQAALVRLPAEQARPRDDKAVASAVAILVAAAEQPPPAAPKGPPKWPERLSLASLADRPDPLAQLAAQLTALLGRLPPDEAGEQATRVVGALMGALFAAEEADEYSPLFRAIQAVTEYLPPREAARLAETHVPPPGRSGQRTRPTGRGRLVVLALAERLPTRTLLAATDGRSVAGSGRDLRGVLQRRAEAASGTAADDFLRLLLALPHSGSRFVTGQGIRLADARLLLTTLAARVSPDRASDHADAVVARMSRSLGESELAVLAEVLDALLGRLPPDRAAASAAKAAQAVVSRACQVTRSPAGGLGKAPSPIALDLALRTLGGRLSPEQATGHVDTLLAVLAKARQADDLCRLARCIEVLSGRLKPGQGEEPLQRAAQPLVAALGKAQSVAEFAQVAATLERFARVPVRIGDEHAVAARKLAEKTKRGLELPPLAEAFAGVLARLPADAAARHAADFAARIVRAAEKTKAPLDLLCLARSLQSIRRYLPPDGEAARRVAGVLFQVWGKRRRRS